MSKGWYVVHTYSGHENKVKLALEKKIQNLNLGDKIFQVKIPTINDYSIKDGKKVAKPKKIFPGYILVEMILDDETWMAIKSIPGVTHFVGSYGSEKPRPLSEKEVDNLFNRLGEVGSKEKVPVVMDFSVGEHVKVIDGPFKEFTGVIEEVYPEKGRLRVKVEIFGRGTPVELDFVQVGKI